METAERVERAIRTRDFDAARLELEGSLQSDTTGEVHALVGLCHFQSQRYEEAALAYEGAMRRDGAREDWRDMMERSRLNAEAAVATPVPDFHYFGRDDLLAPVSERTYQLPSPPHPAPMVRADRVRRRIGNGLGAILSASGHAVVGAWGALVNYRDDVWTNWYRRNVTLGMLTLAVMRERLTHRNVRNTYPAGPLTAFEPSGQQPPEGATHFRTADGTWNNLSDPKEGSAGTRFMRNINLSAIRPESGEQLMTPNPREISRRLLTRGTMKEMPFLNMLGAAWIQFQNNDWISHGDILFNDVHEIPLAEDDPARRKYRQGALFVGKSQPDPTRQPDGEPAAVTHINEVTHWWDGSQIYGSDQATQNRLRSFVGGKMRLEADGRLAVDRRVEDVGMRRNWWVGLALLHTVFVKEHNAICDHLLTCYPHWDDNRLFNTARLVNAGVIAKIHSIEWTTAILPNRGLHAALNANWYGIATNLFQRGKNRRTVAEINIRQAELGGLVGNPIAKYGLPFGLSEEFTEIYRLHSLLPEAFHLKKVGEDTVREEVPFSATRQAGSPRLTARWAIDDMLYSFGTQNCGQLVLRNYPRFLQELSIPGNPLFDMGAVDILRARERGVPRYNEFRRQLQLGPIRSFDELTPDASIVRDLRALYGDRPEDVERLDLMIGTLGEGHRPTNFGFGETLFQIFIFNASRRLQADRFYTDNYNAETYTKEGMDWIDAASLRSVLLRHYPQLSRSGLANVTNAFEPWDTGAELDPLRHPLREFEYELRHEPWRGDAYR